MSWNERLTSLIYTSPSGIEFTGVFEDVSKEIEKKTTSFNFPDVAGTYIQDLGPRGRKYPLKFIFWGDDYDKTAESFDSALEEKGPGILQHPLYGTFDVVPFGTIKRSDNLVSSGNQAIYEVTFYQTIKIVFPISELVAENAMIEGFETFSNNAILNYDQSISIVSAQEITSYIDSAKSGLNKIKKAMATIAATSAEIQRTFNDAISIAENTIETLIGGPTLIASQLISITRLPSQAVSSIQAKLDAYGSLIESLIDGPGNQFSDGLDAQAGNAYSNNNLIASAAVLAAIESTISDETVFQTRTDIIDALESLDTLFVDYINWSDVNREGLIQDVLLTREPGTNDLIDTGEAYQNLLDVFSISQGRLTEISFTALQERSVILDRDRTFIDFAAEYYGQLDEKYDFIIQSNKLSGIELFELKKGRKMVYYV